MMSAPLLPEGHHRMVEDIKQSGPVDPTAPYDESRVAGKTILITGGAAGIGAAFARKWAGLGANLVIGDVDVVAGEELVAELRASTSNPHHFFQRCDVTDWQSQVELFQAGVHGSPTGGIDVVVPNAGVADYATPASGKGFENPTGLDTARPPPPPLHVLATNLTGVFYTVHLALFWLPRNGNLAGGADGASSAAKKSRARDRHILLVGSVAGLMPLAGQTQYVAAKHGVTGLFRSLRATSWRHGTRVNMLCPYFVDTGINPRMGLSLLAGMGELPVSDVADAATRLVADEGIVGRALVVGPRFSVVDGGGDSGETRVVVSPSDDGSRGAWEPYAHDYEAVEAFVWRYTRYLNTYEYISGWVGWARDMIRIWYFRKRPNSSRGEQRVS